MSNLSKRIITSLVLLLTVSLAFIYSYVLIILLILVSVFSWIEFNNIIKKIFISDNIKISFYKVLLKGVSLIYLVSFSALIFNSITQDLISFNNIYYSSLIFICMRKYSYKSTRRFYFRR